MSYLRKNCGISIREKQQALPWQKDVTHTYISLILTDVCAQMS